MTPTATTGLVSLPSKYSVEETMQRLESLLTERGITIFARVDHSGEAKTKKAQLKAAANFTSEYFDRRAQAKFV